MAVLIV